MGNSPLVSEHSDRFTMAAAPGSHNFVTQPGAGAEAAPPDPLHAPQLPHQAAGVTPTPRIRIDIRGLHEDNDYVVHIRRESRRELEGDLRSAWNGIQAVGGLAITILTVQKLWEDIRFIRLLRRELSTLVGSLAGSGGGADDGSDGARPPRPLGGAGSHLRPAAPPPSTRNLDLDLNDLSSMLDRANRGGRAASEGKDTTTSQPTGSAPPQSQHQHQQANGAAKSAAGEQNETTWASISGLTDIKILLQEATVLPTLRPDLFQGIRQPPKALLLFGPPGTGKTMLARAVAAESRATFLPVTGSSVLSMWYGQSEQNVKALFEKARKRQPAIIFIDEVDSLLGKRSSGGPRESTPDKRVTNEFLAFIDGIQTQQAGDTRIMVIAATNTPWDLDEAALSRFSRRIYVPLPDKSTREALMRKALQGLTCDITDDEWQRLAERCDKYSGRDLVQVCREAAMRPLRELWGRRLLEGSPASLTSASGSAAGCASSGHHSAAHERLVELVAKSLAGALSPSAHSGPSSGGCGNGNGRSDSSKPGAGAAAGAAAGEQHGQQQQGAGGGHGRSGCDGKRRWRLFGFGFGDHYTSSKRQARRELERWKRRHRASWCDVDLIMQQADRRVQARRQAAASEGAHGHGHGHGQATTEAPKADAQEAEAPEVEGPGAAVSDERPQAAQGLAPEQPGADGQLQQPAVEHAGEQQQQPQTGRPSGEQDKSGTASEAATAFVHTGAAGAEAGARDPPEDLIPAGESTFGPSSNGNHVTGATGRAATCTMCSRACCTCVAPAAAAADYGAAASVPKARRQPAIVASGVGGQDTGPSHPGGDPATAAADAAAAAAQAGASDAPTAAAKAGAVGTPAAAAKAGAADAPAAAANAPILRLEDLLSMPTARVRPIIAADLEGALRVISCTEMDQTARYTEWDEQYGSGATGSGSVGGRGRGWMSMYV